MTAVREAIVLPFLFLTVTLLSSVEFGSRLAVMPPSLFSLVLATMMVAALVRSGTIEPTTLMHASRSILANTNGALVIGTLFAASAQLLSRLTPRTGLPLFFTSVLLFVLLLNTLVAMPPRERLLRSLAVTLGSTLVLKFVVLASLSAPASSRTGRVFTALFDAATFGSITQEPQSTSAGYVAFAAVGLYLVAAGLLPRKRFERSGEMHLERR